MMVVSVDIASQSNTLQLNGPPKLKEGEMNHAVDLRVEVFESISLRLQRALFLEDDMHVGSGDVLKLREQNLESGMFSGRWLDVRVTHVQRITMGVGALLPRQMIVLSIDNLVAGQEPPYFLDVSGSRQAA